MQEVTDPKILAQLNNSSDSKSGQEVTDPNILAQLNQPSQSSDLASKATSVVGGLSSGGADLAQGGSDSVTFLLKHLHVISPKTADKLYKASKENTDLFRPEAGGWNGAPDTFTQANDTHPYLGMGAKLAVDTAGMVEGMKATGAMGKFGSALLQGSPMLATTGGIAGRALGMGLLGQAGANAPDKETSFGLNAALSPAFDAAGAAASSLGSKAAITQKINDVVSTISNKVNPAYKAVKDMAFTPEDATGVQQVGMQINNILQDTSIMKSPKQTRLLTNLVGNIQGITNHADLLKTLQQTGAITKDFKGLQASDSLYSSFTSIKQSMENVINQAAIKNGIDGALTTATDLGQQSRLLDKTVGELQSNPQTFNFTTANKKLNVLINKYKDIPQMAQTVDVLKGVEKLTDEGSHIYKVPGLAFHAAGAVAGGSAAYELSGGNSTAGIMGSVAGGLGAPLVLHLIRDLSSNPNGQAFLRSLAKPGITQKNIRDVVKAMGVMGVNKVVNDTNNNGAQ